MSTNDSFSGVTLHTKANVYFDGKCVSHTFLLTDGTRKSAGVILPSTLTFSTAAAERMEIIDGDCKVRLAGSEAWVAYAAGQTFDVPANSSFDIEVSGAPFHYVCHFV